MNIPNGNFIEIFLQPGEFYVGDAGYRIRTLLGSCVSITLWHPVLRVGAMSHFLLSDRNDRKKIALDGHYGSEAMWLMLRELVRADVNPAECEAKVFGGGNMFPKQRRSTTLNVGEKNGEAARSWLRDYGIRKVSEDLFGAGHRQLIFDIASGDVWVNQVEPSEPAPLPKKKEH
jgi:chemotaxis protein CheD